MFNVKNTNTGEIIQLDFDTMTDKELRDLENSIATYRIQKKERDIRKSIDTIIDCIETELRKTPSLKDKIAIEGEEFELDWFDLISGIKDAYY